MRIPAEITLITNQSERTEQTVKGFVEIGDPFVLWFDGEDYSAKITLCPAYAQIVKSGDGGYIMNLAAGFATDFVVEGLTLKIRTQKLRFKASDTKMDFAAQYYFEPDSNNATSLIIKATYNNNSKP